MEEEDFLKEKSSKQKELLPEQDHEMACCSELFAANQQQSVKKKLKTLTFCRRRKGIKEVSQKRKSSWTFKFGPKVRDCSNTSVPIAGDTSDSCICTVYRRTDQSSSIEALDFSKVDCLPKCVLNSKGTKPQRLICTNDGINTENESSSAINKKAESILPGNLNDSFNSRESQTQESHNLSYNDPMEYSLQYPETNKLPSMSDAKSEVLQTREKKDISSSSKNQPETCILGDGMSAYKNERLPNTDLPVHNESLQREFQAGANEEDNPDDNFIEEMIMNPEEYPVEDWDERARLQRAKEMEEGVDPPPGYKPKQITQQAAPAPIQDRSISELAMYLQNHLLLKSSGTLSLSMEDSNEKSVLSRNVLEMLQELTLSGLFSPPIHTQVDYIHCLVPDLLDITSCSCYWGKMDRYEAEKLLENKSEGTFLLRDSAQEEFLFSVSFQRYGKTLHARIEQWNHKFSFDSHDPGVFSSGTVCGLIEHYKDPSCCMYFDPMLTIPLHRTFTFSLQHLSRSVICNNITYDGINNLKLPKSLKSYLKEYHYKQRVKVRRFDY